MPVSVPHTARCPFIVSAFIGHASDGTEHYFINERKLPCLMNFVFFLLKKIKNKKEQQCPCVSLSCESDGPGIYGEKTTHRCDGLDNVLPRTITQVKSAVYHLLQNHWRTHTLTMASFNRTVHPTETNYTRTFSETWIRYHSVVLV